MVDAWCPEDLFYVHVIASNGLDDSFLDIRQNSISIIMDLCSLLLMPCTLYTLDKNASLLYDIP